MLLLYSSLLGAPVPAYHYQPADEVYWAPAPQPAPAAAAHLAEIAKGRKSNPRNPLFDMKLKVEESSRNSEQDTSGAKTM